jgi:hypothetical protein
MHGIAMQRGGENIASVIEKILRAVAVVEIDIQHRDFPRTMVEQPLRGDT